MASHSAEFHVQEPSASRVSFGSVRSGHSDHSSAHDFPDIFAALGHQPESAFPASEFPARPRAWAQQDTEDSEVDEEDLENDTVVSKSELDCDAYSSSIVADINESLSVQVFTALQPHLSYVCGCLMDTSAPDRLPALCRCPCISTRLDSHHLMCQTIY